MSQPLQLPDDVYKALREAADASGLTLEAWIASRLPMRVRNGRTPTAIDVAGANTRLRKHIISSGRIGRCDNDQIDADLAKEYGGEYSGTSRREKH